MTEAFETPQQEISVNPPSLRKCKVVCFNLLGHLDRYQGKSEDLEVMAKILFKNLKGFKREKITLFNIEGKFNQFAREYILYLWQGVSIDNAPSLFQSQITNMESQLVSFLDELFGKGKKSFGVAYRNYRKSNKQN